MKRVVVYGATGKTGKEIVKKLLSEDYETTAFVRDPSRLEIQNKYLKVLAGDIFNQKDVQKAVAHQDAVIIALGSGQSLSKTTIRATGTEHIIKAMHENQVTRLIAVSAMGVGDSWKDLSVLNRLFFATLLRNSKKDHEAQEQLIIKSALDWTIVRPSGLTDDPGTGIYSFETHVQSKKFRIARADVAHLIHKVLDDATYVRKAITITN